MRMNETVLEMHYHRPLMDLFRETFGLGKSGQINFYKYSPRKECFIGFDQAYVKTQLSEDNFFDILQKSASNDGYALKEAFVGYFLQFKVVKRMQKMTRVTPSCITRSPHYRVDLDTTKNQKTGFSQHELLWNLKSNNGAMVYYACPMIFEKEDLYEVNVELDTLRLADVNTCPSAYQDNGKHHIYFNTPDESPFWCSDPVKGEAVTPRSFAEMLNESVSGQRARASAELLVKILQMVRRDAFEVKMPVRKSDDVFGDLGPLANLLTIARVSRNE